MRNKKETRKRKSITKDHYAFPSLKQMRDAMNAGNENIPQKEVELWVGHEDELARNCGLR